MNTKTYTALRKEGWGQEITLRGILPSQSGKLITLAALPTQSTTTVANICTRIRKKITDVLVIFRLQVQE